MWPSSPQTARGDNSPASSQHTDYFVRIAIAGRPPALLFETIVPCVDGPQDACTVAVSKWQRTGAESAPENAWVEVFEMPDDVIVLRVSARLATPHRC